MCNDKMEAFLTIQFRAYVCVQNKGESIGNINAFFCKAYLTTHYARNDVYGSGSIAPLVRNLQR
jgi:hypothetical protein